MAKKAKVIKILVTVSEMMNARDNMGFATHRDYVAHKFKLRGYEVIAPMELKYFTIVKRGQPVGWIVEGNPGLSLMSR